MTAGRFLKSGWFDLLVLLSFCAFFLLFALGRGSLASWDEGVYAVVSKEILRSGQWFRLTLEGRPWPDNPPFFLWATTLFYRSFGVSEFSARLCSALAGIGTVLVTYAFGSRLYNRTVGFLGALVLLSSSHFIHFARFGQPDVLMTFFLSAALYFFWRGRDKNRYLLFSGLAIGLAVMTKGFAAFMVFPVIWAYCLWSGETDLLGRSSYWIGVILAVLVALPWHLYEWLATRAPFAEGVTVGHFWEGVAGAFEGQVRNAYFYIRTMVNKYHPWTLVSIFSAPFILFRALKDRFEEDVFVISWIFVIFGVITLARAKEHWYILPLYPPLSLTVGCVLARVFGEEQKNWLVALFLGIMVLHVPYSHIFDHDYSRDIKGIAPALVRAVPAGETVHLYRYQESPALSFYTARPSVSLEGPEAFLEKARREKRFYGLVRAGDWRSLERPSAGLGVRLVAVFEDLRLVAKKAK